MTVRKAVIPAAGLGTRFLPATKAVPKVMLPVLDTPAIQYVVEEAVAAGIREILIVTGPHERSIRDHFEADPSLEGRLRDRGDEEAAAAVRRPAELADIRFVRQQEPNGLGDAIGCARKFTENEPFAVLLGDAIIDASVPAIAQLLRAHEKCGTSVLLVERVPRERVSRYGIVAGRPVGDRLQAVTALVEKPDPAASPSDLAVAGRYVLTPGFYDALDRTPPGRGREIQVTDALHRLLATEPVHAWLLEGRRHDVGDRLDYVATQVAFALARSEFREPLAVRLRRLLEDVASGG